MSQFSPLANYRLIGDLYSSALVSATGSIEWLCLPHFDSSSVFARILDKKKGGSFGINSDQYQTNCSYASATAIVTTRFQSDNHTFTLQDFMLPQPTATCTNHVVCRKLTGESGEGSVGFSFDPQPNYAQTTSSFLYNEKEQKLKQATDQGRLILHLPADAHVEKSDNGWTICVPLEPEDSKQLVFECAQEEVGSCIDKHNFETETRDFWRDWTDNAEGFDFCSQRMIRSAITLKLLQFYPTGALIAAPTTSLPETIGGSRNWDYRYVWIRDAAYTLYSLDILGLKSEARKFFEYIESIAFEEEEDSEITNLRHLYSIHGTTVQPEASLEQFSGYKDSGPVRVGNDAGEQFQLDTYGTMIDSFYLAQREGVTLTDRQRHLIIKLAEKIADRWQEKDRGIWEVRSEPQHYTHSKVMCWVGLNRTIRMHELLDLSEKRVKKLQALADQIKGWVWKHCFDEETNLITQHPQTDAVDATTFLFPLVQFLDKESERTKEIIANTREKLCFDDVFVYRYQNDDGLAGQEGAFVLATFWMISTLAKIGEVAEAQRLFTKFDEQLADSGLMAEEINPDTGEYLGNFPQAFSHMGYIMAAYYIQRYQAGD